MVVLVDQLDALTCPLSLEKFVDPVIMVGDGHTYERWSIEQWFAIGRSSSPLTGQKISKEGRRLIPNYTIKKMIEEIAAAPPAEQFHHFSIASTSTCRELPPSPHTPNQRPPPPLPPRPFSLSASSLPSDTAHVDDREYALQLIRDEIKLANELQKQCALDEAAARELAAADAAREQTERQRMIATDAIKARQLADELRAAEDNFNSTPPQAPQAPQTPPPPPPPPPYPKTERRGSKTPTASAQRSSFWNVLSMRPSKTTPKRSNSSPSCLSSATPSSSPSATTPRR